MNDKPELTTLQRKAGVGRAPSDGAGMTPKKSLRLALSKVAQDELRLALKVLTISEELLDQDGLLDVVEEGALLLLLDGPLGALGVAIIDTQFLAAVIEVQTMGSVRQGKAKNRTPTRTDSAMMEMVLNALFREFGENLEGSSAESWTTGFQQGERITNIRLLGLRLEDIDYRFFRASLDLADGAKQGNILFALPANGRGSTKSADAAVCSWAQDLGETVRASHGEINAVLYRAQIPLNVARNFKPGDDVPIPVSAISRIMMEGVDGRVVGFARLGQKNGNRALRLSCGGTTETVGADPAKAAVEINIPEPATDLADHMQIDAPQPLNSIPDIPLDAMAGMGEFDPANPLPDIGMPPLGDLPELPNDDLEIQPMAAMPMEISVD